jgi:beta-1,4-mannosyltransferase
VELQFQGFQTEQGSPVHEAVSAARYYTSRDGKDPWLFAYTPVARMNPYQALSYGSFGEHGLAVTPVTDPWSFDSLTVMGGQTEGVIVHLHWLSVVLADARSAAEAAEKSAAFLAKMSGFRAKGGKIVWTVHNMVSHDARFLEEELRLQQAVADEADLIHVMTEDTPELVAQHLRLDPDKTICVPHPGYQGAYPDVVPHDHARLALGLDPDETVYLAFGAIKAYKGIERLVEGFNVLLERSSAPRRLIIAGGADSDRQTAELVRQLRMHPYVLVDDTKVPSDKAQYLLRAADLMVLPHVRALNSGGALLGPTFGLPVVASSVGVLPGLLGPEIAEFIQGDTPEDIADALERADRLRNEASRAAARAFADRHHPHTVSPMLAQAIRAGLKLDEGDSDA